MNANNTNYIQKQQTKSNAIKIIYANYTANICTYVFVCTCILFPVAVAPLRPSLTNQRVRAKPQQSPASQHSRPHSGCVGLRFYWLMYLRRAAATTCKFKRISKADSFSDLPPARSRASVAHTHPYKWGLRCCWRCCCCECVQLKHPQTLLSRPQKSRWQRKRKRPPSSSVIIG